MHLIESGIPFSEFVVMMQKEVADRNSAAKYQGFRAFVDCRSVLHMTAKVAFIKIPRTVFVPAPNVDLSYPEMVRRPEPAVAVEDEKFFLRFPRLVSLIVVRPCNNFFDTGYQTEEVKGNRPRLWTRRDYPCVRGAFLA